MRIIKIVFLGLFVLLNTACSNNGNGSDSDDSVKITILYTNDEHGWMEPVENIGGAAGLMELWKTKEGYNGDDNFLILSGGDNWTGPAISTWFKGESMVDVMNAMEYDATTIGNHEFDFKTDGLRQRIAQADFPFLSSNIRMKGSNEIPDFATPYTIIEIDGVSVGIIGLTTTSAPTSTFPDFVKDFDFIAYNDALQEIVPEVKTAGAQIMIVIGHLCEGERRALNSSAKSLGISVITGGHCHDLHSSITDGIVSIEGGSNLQSYAKVELVYNKTSAEITSKSASTHYNDGTEQDAQVAQVVQNWKVQMGTQLSQAIGYVESTLGRNTNAMFNMVTDSWLVSFPEADVALTNAGGIRQDVPAGEITLETMVGVLPFENSIYELDMSGTELKNVIGPLVFGGMTMTDGYKLSDGTPIYDDSVYQVLTTDYLYSRPDYSFSSADPEPYQTSVHYRQPVIDWIQSLNTSQTQPLDNFLDYESRR